MGPPLFSLTFTITGLMEAKIYFELTGTQKAHESTFPSLAHIAKALPLLWDYHTTSR